MKSRSLLVDISEAEDCKSWKIANVGMLVGDIISCEDNATPVFPVGFGEFAVLDMA